MKTDNNTHEARVSFETAKMLKEAGFDWEVDTAFVRDYEDIIDDDAEYIPLDTFAFIKMPQKNWNEREISTVQCGKNKGMLTKLSAPTLDVAQRWLREVKNIEVYSFPMCVCIIPDSKEYAVSTLINRKNNTLTGFTTNESAIEAGIQKCLTILLEEKK